MRAKRALVVVLSVLVLAALACDSGADPTATPTGETMYVCGYDTCRDSGEYGDLLYSTGINAWNNPDPDRGGVKRQLRNGQQVTVIEQKRVYSGPGGLWYKLRDGGWISDFWLTETVCTPENLAGYSFKDCLGGEY